MIFSRICMRISEASIRVMRVHQHMMRRFSCDKKMPMVDTSLDRGCLYSPSTHPVSGSWCSVPTGPSSHVTWQPIRGQYGASVANQRPVLIVTMRYITDPGWPWTLDSGTITITRSPDKYGGTDRHQASQVRIISQDIYRNDPVSLAHTTYCDFYGLTYISIAC